MIHQRRKVLGSGTGRVLGKAKAKAQ